MFERCKSLQYTYSFYFEFDERAWSVVSNFRIVNKGLEDGGLFASGLWHT